MRIRTIKPEFWRSDDITALSREDRLLFIGLWSYVDDNGVGLDDYRQIAADLFALEEDQKEIRDYVREGLGRLARGSLLVRYMIDGKALLFIRAWDRHQRVHHPNQPRYPRPPTDPPPPTSDNGDSPEGLPNLSGESPEGLPPVTEEQGSNYIADADASATQMRPPQRDLEAGFEDFWAAWPRKTAKPKAREKYRAALRAGAAPERILASARAQAEAWRVDGKDRQFIPYPATWLHQARYDDEIERPKFRVIHNPDAVEGWG